MYHGWNGWGACLSGIVQPKNPIGDRIRELRRAHDLTQEALAGKVGVSKGQVIRYETKGAVPSADVLSKMADLFGTTVDVLVNGHAPDKAQAALKSAELLKHFRQLEELPDADLQMFVKLIAAYLRDHKTRQAYA